MPIPNDGLAAFRSTPYMASPFSQISYTWNKTWLIDGADVAPLLQQFGEYPEDLRGHFPR
jgi:hypothetical protein